MLLCFPQRLWKLSSKMVFTGPCGATFNTPGNLTPSPSLLLFSSLLFSLSPLLFLHYFLYSLPLHSDCLSTLTFPLFPFPSLSFLLLPFSSCRLILSLLVFLFCLIYISLPVCLSLTHPEVLFFSRCFLLCQTLLCYTIY